LISLPFQHSVPLTPEDSPQPTRFQTEIIAFAALIAARPPLTPFGEKSNDAAGFPLWYGLLNCSPPKVDLFTPLSHPSFNE